VVGHYERLAGRYDEFLSYSDDFVPRLADRMIRELRLEPQDRLVDLGGGSGLYSIEIVRQLPLRHPVLCVDPVQAMLDRIPDGAPLEPVGLDALSFSRQDRSYDKILMKEAIHHVDEKEELFANLHRRLPRGGVLLLIHVPPKLDYPLFEAALRRAETWHAHPEDLVRWLENAGFEAVPGQHVHRHRLPTERYMAMVANQYMSVLSSFSRAEIDEGLREMERMHAGKEVLEFDDRFDVITAVKR